MTVMQAFFFGVAAALVPSVLTLFLFLPRRMDLQRERERLISAMAVIFAEEIGSQTEIDNLGDGESVIFLAESPVVNLIRLAERVV